MATKVGKRYKTSVYLGTVDGKRKYEVFYADKAWQADAAADKFKKDRERKNCPERITLGEAIDAYIASRDAVLSPATIAAYKSMRKYRMQSLMPMRIADINNRVLQNAVNEEAKTKTHNEKPINPKTVKNTAGLIISSIRYYDNDANFRIAYPEQPKIQYATPDTEMLKRIFAAIKGTRIELPVMLSVWLSLSASEILGLKWEDIRDEYLSINAAMVYTNDGGHYKATKERSRTRNIIIDPYLRERLLNLPKQDDIFIFTLTRNQMTKEFTRVLKTNNIPHCRFHDLRHANASLMALLNIPDRYAQERGGWSTGHIMKGVYQQVFSDEQRKVAQTINEHIKGLMQTNMHTEK